MKYPDLFNPDISRIGVAESQMYNLVAGRLVTDTVRTSFGPRGMDKVYIDILGEETVTNHGGAFLRKIDVDHPAAKMVIDAVNTVDRHVGDGTIATAIVLGALLGRSRVLLRAGVPTAVIISGLEDGLGVALAALDDIKIPSRSDDMHMMAYLVDSCLEGKTISHSLPNLSVIRNMIIDAVCTVADLYGQSIDTDDIKIEEKQGNSSDMRLVRGTVIDKTIDCPAMPVELHDVRVLLLNDPLETMRTKTESEIEVSSSHRASQFLEQENRDILMLARKVADSGARLVVSRKGISELAQEFLARAGIISVRRAKYNDLWWLEKCTGAKTCMDVQNILPGELGFASSVYEHDVGTDRMLFVESVAPKSVTLLLRSVSRRHLDEFHRTAKNAIFVLRNFIKDPLVVHGGGSCEMLVAEAVRRHADLTPGKRQLAIRALAEALEEVPLTLARNVGMSILDVLPKLRAGTAASPDRWWGIDSHAKRVAGMVASQIFETAQVKGQVLRTAVETATAILNVNDVFVKDLIDNTHCHIDGTVHAHKDPGRNHNHWEQEGLEQRQMHHYY